MWARMLGNLWIIASFVPEIFRRRWSSCSGCFAGAGGLLHCGDRWQSPRHGWQSINLDTAFPAEEPRAQRISDPNTPGYYQRWSILHHLRWIERWHRRNTQTRTNAGSWIAKGAYSCAATAVAAAGDAVGECVRALTRKCNKSMRKQHCSSRVNTWCSLAHCSKMWILTRLFCTTKWHGSGAFCPLLLTDLVPWAKVWRKILMAHCIPVHSTYYLVIRSGPSYQVRDAPNWSSRIIDEARWKFCSCTSPIEYSNSLFL